MKKWLVLGLLMLAAIVTMFLTTHLTMRLFFVKEKIIGRVEIPMDFEVNNYLGIVTDPDALHFGTMPPGNRGERFIILNNTNTFPVRVTATFKGEAGKYVWTTAELTLEAGEGRELSILLTVPSHLAHGNYTGTAYFTFREAR